MPRNLDINQLAKLLVDQATGEAPKPDVKKQAAGRKGGAVGGKKRMAALTEAQRTELALIGVGARKNASAGEAEARKSDKKSG